MPDKPYPSYVGKYVAFYRVWGNPRGPEALK